MELADLLVPVATILMLIISVFSACILVLSALEGIIARLVILIGLSLELHVVGSVLRDFIIIPHMLIVLCVPWLTAEFAQLLTVSPVKRDSMHITLIQDWFSVSAIVHCKAHTLTTHLCHVFTAIQTVWSVITQHTARDVTLDISSWLSVETLSMNALVSVLLATSNSRMLQDYWRLLACHVQVIVTSAWMQLTVRFVRVTTSDLLHRILIMQLMFHVSINVQLDTQLRLLLMAQVCVEIVGWTVQLVQTQLLVLSVFHLFMLFWMGFALHRTVWTAQTVMRQLISVTDVWLLTTFIILVAQATVQTAIMETM